MEYLSPLRYPGGKAKVSDFLQKLITENALSGGYYVEPYVGGGSVALSLLFNNYVNEIFINDKDVSIYAFWYSVLYKTDELCRLISDTPIDIDTWKKLRKLQDNKTNIDLLNLGFSTFYQNRTNRSGILKAGVIGGLSQIGNYKMDARFNKKDLIKRIQNIAQKADKIHLTNEDAIDSIKRLSLSLPKNTLFYLDPPYYVKGKGLYMNYYTDADHCAIADSIKEIMTQKWILSYYNVPFVRNLYTAYRHKLFELNYSASNSGKGEEIMFFSDNLNVPEHKLFNAIKNEDN